jgi:peroxiredoxin
MNSDSNSSTHSGEKLRIGLPVASLILGIISVAYSLFVIGAILALIGFVLGLVHLKRRHIFRSLAVWGISLSTIGFLGSVFFGYVYYQQYKQVRAILESTGEEAPSLDNWEGVRAPELTVATIDGTNVRLKDLQGKRVVLDFWATWCPPCVREIPHFIRLVGQTSRDDLIVVGISSEDKDVLQKFVEDKGINYPIASGSNLSSPYGDIRSVPTTFFIDRKGVIQNVFVGYHDYDMLRSAALAKDYEGQALDYPRDQKSGLQEPNVGNNLAHKWDLDIAGCSGICTGDWDGDGIEDILIIDRHKHLYVVSLEGQIKNRISLPASFSEIEIGKTAAHGARLLGYSTWGRQVTVLDTNGTAIWEYPTRIGVNGAHWGDLDGDGGDELIVGMNGNGGLHAVSSDGKDLWKVKSIGNVWNQAMVSSQEPNGCQIFATEAGGTIRVYDGNGRQRNVLRPFNRYYAQMTASVVDDRGTVQIIALGQGRVVALSPDGKVAWSTKGVTDERAWGATVFACGHMEANGTADWVFQETLGNLVIATPEGVKLASLPVQGKLTGFAVANSPNKNGCLVIMKPDLVQAYTLTPQEKSDVSTEPPADDNVPFH